MEKGIQEWAWWGLYKKALKKSEVIKAVFHKFQCQFLNTLSQISFSFHLINPFIANAPILYPLKTLWKTLCNCFSISSHFLPRHLFWTNWQIFKFFLNCCFKRVWPGSELLIWYAVCCQNMSFRDMQ